MTSDESFMKQAVKQAKKAYDKLETPIGCVIVHEDKIIARGYNKRNMKKNTLAHAEILAINKASKVLGDWRLEDDTRHAAGSDQSTPGGCLCGTESVCIAD